MNQLDGQAAHVIGLARAFTGLGEGVRLLVSATTVVPVSIPKVDIVTIPNIGLPAIRAALRHVKAYRPDIIYERRFSPKLGSTISLVTRVPYFLEINGLPETEFSQSADGNATRAGRILRPGYRIPRRIIVPSARLADLLVERLRLPRRKFCVIPNGVDLSLFAPRDKTAARRALGLPIDKRIVAYVGKLAPWQGLDTLIDSAEPLAQIPGIQILLVGDGPSRESIAARIAAKHLEATIRLVGPVPHEKVPIVLAAADLCVAPFSKKRNDQLGISPIKLFEYLAAGRPIVASDVSGVSEIVRDAGVLVAPDSATNLASAIADLLLSPTRLANFERRASELAKENSWEIRARAILDVVRPLPDTRSRG